MEPHPDMEAEAMPVAKAVPANAIDVLPPRKPAGSVLTPMARMGVPGYGITGGYILPRDVDRRLSPRERYRLYEENLVNVAIIATGVRYFLDLVSGASWNFEPADDSKPAADVAEFVQDALIDDMETSFSRVIRRQARYKFDGFQIQEWTAKPREDGRIGFHDIEPRPCHTIEQWDIDERGSVRGVIQMNPNNGQTLYLPRQKLIYVTDDTLSDSPEGLGLFRHLIRSAAGITRFEDLEHWGFETDLQGIPVGRAPLAALDRAVEDGQISKDAAAMARNVMDHFIANHIRGPKTGMVLDSATYTTTDDRQAPSNQRLWDLELLKSGGTSHAQINEAIKRKTQELARLLGVEHLLLGSEGGGSLALSQSSTRRLHGMVNSTLHELKDVGSKQMIKPLMMLNNIPRALWPKPKPEEIAYRTVEEVTGALASLAQAGVPLMPGDAAVDEVRDLIGLSRSDPKMMDIQRIEAGLLALSAGQPAPGGEDDDDEGADSGSRSGGRKPTAGGRDLTATLNELRDYLATA
jgi:hypothetical protein